MFQLFKKKTGQPGLALAAVVDGRCIPLEEVRALTESAGRRFTAFPALARLSLKQPRPAYSLHQCVFISSESIAKVCAQVKNILIIFAAAFYYRSRHAGKSRHSGRRNNRAYRNNRRARA